MRNTMILAGLLVLAGAARAGESLSPEALLPVHEGRDAYAPGAAHGKDVYLLVWQSGRIGEGDLTKGLPCIGDIVGCRADKSGKPIDAEPFVISGAKDMQERPKVAFGKDIFLVVWQDLRNGKDWDVYAARISPEGKVLDPDGIPVAAGPHNQALPRVAWDGKAFQVVWQDFRSGKSYEVYGARVSAEGRVLDAEGVLLVAADRVHWQRYAPSAASRGDGTSFVLWLGNCVIGQGDLGGSVFVKDGKVVKPGAFVNKDTRKHGPAHATAPTAAAAGPKACLAAWTTYAPVGRGNAADESNAAVFDAEGQRSKALFLAGKKTNIRDPEVAWDGAAFVAAWHEFVQEKRELAPSDVIFAARITEAGEPAGEVHRLSGTSASPASMAAVASDGAGTTLVAYEKHPDKPEVPIKIGYRLLTAR
jgi:hypothetical protein